MQNDEHPEAIIRSGDSGFEVVLSRWLDADRTAVWRMLTESDRLKDWLAPGAIEPHLGGSVSLDFSVSGTAIDSVVRAVEPHALLEYSWSSGAEPVRPLRWELADEDGGTRLHLTLRFPGDEDAAKTAAGWDAHLEMLTAAAAGVPISFPVERFKLARQVFRDQLASCNPNSLDSACSLGR
ncbi:SRPBCC family protein [Aquisalimonas lutea]|uniref:SRPBCC family protein n=1 Tax=Aquisalimonas lutea TaxID=1327750 RepID=UPI0025B4589B|nr:SRPBCC family protein [Aquisalimonas lutea]MDN3519850.1 SRPBCC family protein [Aquisalimonas lutea]